MISTNVQFCNRERIWPLANVLFNLNDLDLETKLPFPNSQLLLVEVISISSYFLIKKEIFIITV